MNGIAANVGGSPEPNAAASDEQQQQQQQRRSNHGAQSPAPPPTKSTAALFTAAATALAQLYRQSMIQSRDAYLDGYGQCARDILQYCQQLQQQQEQADGQQAQPAMISVDALLSLLNSQYAMRMQHQQSQSLGADSEDGAYCATATSLLREMDSQTQVHRQPHLSMPKTSSSPARHHMSSDIPPASKRSRPSGGMHSQQSGNTGAGIGPGNAIKRSLSSAHVDMET